MDKINSQTQCHLDKIKLLIDILFSLVANSPKEKHIFPLTLTRRHKDKLFMFFLEATLIFKNFLNISFV